MKRLFVASFNVKNLIQAGKPIYDDPKPLYSPEAYKKKVAWIRNQFAEMNAAIVGVQEVFEAVALKACLEKQEEWSVILPPDPDNLPKGDISTMNFASGGNTEAKAWRDIWGCGQGIGAVHKVETVADRVDRMEREYLAARERLKL